ncbi:unnamed protein product [Adineta ricciae]|uniref:Uncharacterized protein n=1 Tax=Adineta ricciae TaxID=249248 RepID=A0A815B0D7_ADIRI|nr:unnamed protein product [Adineta ricciae]CAF1266992.1 unnamed protein product [Adineta ricciae]
MDTQDLVESNDNSVSTETFGIILLGNTGVDNQEAVDQNKQEIYKAFQQCPNSVVAFVFSGGSSGRVKDEDLVAFNAIHKAFHFQQYAADKIRMDQEYQTIKEQMATQEIALQNQERENAEKNMAVLQNKISELESRQLQVIYEYVPVK